MNIRLHKKFEKKYVKLRKQEKEKFKQRRDIFLENPYDPVLNNHALQGKYLGLRSINITGDLRALYEEIGDTAHFVEIDTHSNLYDK